MNTWVNCCTSHCLILIPSYYEFILFTEDNFLFQGSCDCETPEDELFFKLSFE